MQMSSQQRLTTFRSEGARMSGDALLNILEIAQAVRMGTLGATYKEIAAEFGCPVEKVVRSLSAVAVRLEAKPFGFRPVTVHLSGPQVEGLRNVATVHGHVGIDRHTKVLEQAARRLAAEPDLLASILDPTVRPVFLDSDDVVRLKEEAEKRNMTPDALAGLIVSIVLKDGMVRAIMDDHDEVGS